MLPYYLTGNGLSLLIHSGNQVRRGVLVIILGVPVLHPIHCIAAEVVEALGLRGKRPTSMGLYRDGG